MNDLAPRPYEISGLSDPKVSALDFPWNKDFPGDRPAKPRFTLEPISSIEPVVTGSWLIKGLLPTSGLAVLYGEPGCGKSFVALDVALHVASGRPWADQSVTQGGVVYICAEGAAGFRKRIVGAREHYGLSADTPFALISTPPNLGAETGDAKDLIDCIRQQSATLGFTPTLVVIDTLARSMVGADESNARDMGGFIANAGRIERELGVLVLVVHHTGKDIDRGMRGSSALHGATSAEWEITGEKASRAIRVAKMKDGDDGQSIMFRMFPTEVGVDDEGDPVTTLLVEVSPATKHLETSKPRSRKPLTGQRMEFVKALKMALDEMGHVPEANDHIPANVKVVTRKQLIRYVEKHGFLADMNDRSRRATLNRHVRDIAGSGHITQYGDYVWLTSET